MKIVIIMINESINWQLKFSLKIYPRLTVRKRIDIHLHIITFKCNFIPIGHPDVYNWVFNTFRNRNDLMKWHEYVEGQERGLYSIDWSFLDCLLGGILTDATCYKMMEWLSDFTYYFDISVQPMKTLKH